MENTFNLKKFLTEGKLLKEEQEIEWNEFGPHNAMAWAKINGKLYIRKQHLSTGYNKRGKIENPIKVTLGNKFKNNPYNMDQAWSGYVNDQDYSGKYFYGYSPTFENFKKFLLKNKVSFVEVPFEEVGMSTHFTDNK